ETASSSSSAHYREYRCETCFKEFDTRAALFSHMNLHGEKKSKKSKRKFACFLCPVSYSNESSLISHMCIHTGESSHNCTIGNCRQGFTSDWYLKRHLNEAHGVLPYECSKCGLKFDRISQRDLHRAEMGHI
ncbi:hypothetical protein PENTCL1PPCAC_25923, partial [Pristionchus entomophagus]